MFENRTFENILQDMLDRVPDDVDSREGSIIYDALAPTAMELAETYSNMDLLLQRTFADTADGDDLAKRVGEFGVNRRRATSAIRKGIFTSKGEPFDIALGSRFSLGDMIYQAVDKIEKGTFRMIAETAGSSGNRDFGELIPLESIAGLGTAYLGAVMIPGEDEETDESLYLKYREYIREKAFGGNRADYKRFINEIQGVGGVRLFRAPQGGGTVRAVIIDSNFNVPSLELIESVQETVDPLSFKGDGYGTAPIGHEVTIEAVESVAVDFEATLTLTSEVSIGQVESLVIDVFMAYLAELRDGWARSEEPIVVRLAQLESRILQLEGVQDITGTTLNGLNQNVTLINEVPVKGAVTLFE